MNGTDKNEFDIEPDDNVSTNVISSNKPFKKINHDLSEKDLASSGVIKLLLNEIVKLEYNVSNLSNYRKKYHETDKERIRLEEKQKHYFPHEALFSLCITIGALLVGLYPSMNGDNNNGNIALGVGIVLIIGAAISKVLKK